MNEIVNKFLLAGDKFMPEMHLKQPEFPYSICNPCTKNKQRIEKFMQTGNTDFIYRNDLDKACFQSDKILKDKAFKIASNPKYDGYQRELALMVYKFFDKKSSGSVVSTERNYHLAKNVIDRLLEKL